MYICTIAILSKEKDPRQEREDATRAGEDKIVQNRGKKSMEYTTLNNKEYINRNREVLASQAHGKLMYTQVLVHEKYYTNTLQASILATCMNNK